MPRPPSDRPRGPKPQRVDADQLLDAAQEVFAREGLRAASLRAIARQAGCDPALIYYHFDSKEAMFTALLDRRFPPVIRELTHLADPSDTRPTVLRLWEVLCIYHRHLGGDPGIRSLVRGEIVRGTEGIQELIQGRMAAAATQVRNLLEQGIARGEVRPGLHPLLATFFFVKLHLEILDVLPMVAPRFLTLTPEAAVREGERGWLELFWRGIAADPLAPLPPLPDSGSKEFRP